MFEVETLKVKVKAETQTFPIKFGYKIRLGLPLYDPYFKKKRKEKIKKYGREGPDEEIKSCKEIPLVLT